MDEFLLIFLGEKTFNSVNVSEMVKSCLGVPVSNFLDISSIAPLCV